VPEGTNHAPADAGAGASTATTGASTAIERIRRQPAALANLDVRELGDVFAASGFFNDVEQAAQAMVKILAGAELGFGAVQSMTSVHVITTGEDDPDKPTRTSVSIGGDLMAARIKRSRRYTYRIVDLTDDRCEVAFYERDFSRNVWEQLPPTVEFTMADAARARLTTKFNWQAHPRKMLFWRCISIGADIHTPDLFGGSTATFDDVGLDVDGAGHLYDEQLTAQLAAPAPAPAIPAPAPQNRAAGGDGGAPRASATAGRSVAAITPGQQRLLFAKTKEAGIHADEHLVKMLLWWVTGEESSDRVPKKLPGKDLDAVLAAIADHAGTVDLIKAEAEQGIERALQALRRFKPEWLPPAAAAAEPAAATAAEFGDPGPDHLPGV
jgi:hypothetical protein